MTRVVLYVRVSTREQAEEGYSVGAQLEKMRYYCKSKEWVIVDEYVDGGFSGSNMERPALKKLIRDARSCRMDMVLVYKLDRLSRSQKDTLYLIEEVFNANAVDFTSMQENFDTSTPLGMAMVGILSVFAQLERSQIAERMMMGKDARAKEGRYLGHEQPPIGYEYDQIKGELVPIEYEAFQVREIYRMFTEEHMSILGIQRAMRERYTTRYGNYAYDSTVRGILMNPVYTGRFVFRGETHKSTHTPIIDDTTFQKAQELLELRKKKNMRRKNAPFAPTTLLSGLLWCGNCGARLGGETHQHKKNGKKYSRKIYACYTRKKNHKMMTTDFCDMRYIDRDELDAFVWDEILSLSIKIESGEDVFKEPNQGEALDIINREIKAVDDKIVRLMDLYAVGSMPTDILTDKIQALNEDKEKLVGRIEEMDAPSDGINRDEILGHIRTAAEIKESGTLEEQRALVFALIDRITINQTSIHVKYRFN